MRRRISNEEKIRRIVRRRRRAADVNARKRAEANGAKVVVDVSRDEIRRRDNETCHLCGGWVSTHDASLDHLLPLAHGGEHTYENIKLAHKGCNSKRGARLLPELNLADFNS